MKNTKKLNWIFPSTWIDNILSILHTFDEKDIQKFIKELNSSFELPKDKFSSDVVESFWKNYKLIDLYHATKIIDPEIIHNEGLLPMKPEDQLTIFRNLFINKKYKVTNDQLEHSLKQVGLETRENNTHVVLDYRHMIEEAGHYLIFGGEFLLCLVVNLPSFRHDLIDVLLNRGIPTIYNIHFPIMKLNEYNRMHIFKEIFEEFSNIKNNNNYFSELLDYTITINYKIDSEYIKNHFHPNNIINWHYPSYGPKIYKNRNNCIMCPSKLS